MLEFPSQTSKLSYVVVLYMSTSSFFILDQVAHGFNDGLPGREGIIVCRVETPITNRLRGHVSCLDKYKAVQCFSM